MTNFGVIIPAYRGSTTLHRSMTSLSQQRFEGDLNVVVAVNDGQRDTLASAKSLARGLSDDCATYDVIRTAEGRSAAFAAAEKLLPEGPRLYLDQDVVLSDNAVQTLAEALSPSTPWHFAVPRLLRPVARSIAIRAYYRAWSQLPYVVHSPATMGAYAVSAVGRLRWHDFPDLHSDDKFVRMQFAPHERVIASSASYEVIAPDGLVALVRARRRYQDGNRELVRVIGRPNSRRDVPRRSGAVAAALAQPRSWPAFVVLAAVHGIAAANGLLLRWRSASG